MSFSLEELEENNGKTPPSKKHCSTTHLTPRNPDAHLGATEQGIEDYDYVRDSWDPDPFRDYCGFRINLGLGNRGFSGREG